MEEMAFRTPTTHSRIILSYRSKFTFTVTEGKEQVPQIGEV